LEEENSLCFDGLIFEVSPLTQYLEREGKSHEHRRSRIEPELTLEEAKEKWVNKRLDESCLRYALPTVSTRYLLPDGQVPLLYLRGVLDEVYYNEAEASMRKINYSAASNSRRECLRDAQAASF